MTDRSQYREYLVVAALAGELDETGRRDLDAACAADPSLLQELTELRELTGRLDAADLTWEEPGMPPGLPDRVRTAVHEESSGAHRAARESTARPDSPPSAPAPPDIDDARISSRRRRASRPVLTYLAAAAALLVVGGVIGTAVTDRLQGPPTGPPGTLGAVEEVSFSTSPDGSVVDAALVAHTWGTETLLEVDGLPVGASFEVVLVREDGVEVSSGTFLGAEQLITCQLNAAVLREDVAELQVRDVTGAVVALSEITSI